MRESQISRSLSGIAVDKCNQLIRLASVDDFKKQYFRQETVRTL